MATLRSPCVRQSISASAPTIKDGVEASILGLDRQPELLRTMSAVQIRLGFQCARRVVYTSTLRADSVAARSSIAASQVSPAKQGIEVVATSPERWTPTAAVHEQSWCSGQRNGCREAS